jgi:PAP2 superfamily
VLQSPFIQEKRMNTSIFKAVLLVGLAAFGWAHPAKADVVTDWNQTAINTVVASGAGGAVQARSMAIVHAAIYDAVNAIDRRHTVYAVDVKAPPGASLEAAAATAAYGVLSRLYWFQTPTFDVALEASLAAMPDGQPKTDGMAVGKEVAYTPGTGPGVYQLTPPAFAAVAVPHWGTVQPLMLKNANQFPLEGPPALTSAEFAKDFGEVKLLGAKNSQARTKDQTDAARFWTISGVVADNDTARQLSAHKGFGVVENARVFALLNMAGADAYIACWEAKYRYNFWRPVTAIRNADSAGNAALAADPNWEPLLPTPAHPEYPSGHAIYSGATERVLQEFFGDKVNVSLTNPAVKITRTYQSLSQMGKEVVDARVWGGIHYRTSDVHAAELGHKVAEYGIQNVLRPVEK